MSAPVSPAIFSFSHSHVFVCLHISHSVPIWFSPPCIYLYLHLVHSFRYLFLTTMSSFVSRLSHSFLSLYLTIILASVFLSLSYTAFSITHRHIVIYLSMYITPSIQYSSPLCLHVSSISVISSFFYSSPYNLHISFNVSYSFHSLFLITMFEPVSSTVSLAPMSFPYSHVFVCLQILHFLLIYFALSCIYLYLCHSFCYLIFLTTMSSFVSHFSHSNLSLFLTTMY